MTRSKVFNSRVVGAHVDSCCGSWCIFLEVAGSDDVRVGTLSMSEADRPEADRIAKKVGEFFRSLE